MGNGVTTFRTVEYWRPGGVPLSLDLYHPGKERAPVVLWLHGGGWFTGDRTLAPDLTRYFAAEGLAMASVDYRLSGDATFPAQLHDVRAAIRFLSTHAAELHLDPDAIGAWGSSAGGHLAALAGVTGHISHLPGESDDSDASLRAVAEGYGAVDLAAIVEESGAPAHMAGPNAPEARLLGGLPRDLPELAAHASPLTFVSPEAPPFHIAHGTADVLVRPSQSVLLHDALEAAGASSELFLLDGVRHGFLNPAGRVDLDGPTVMDDGLLESSDLPRASRLSAGDSTRVTYSYDTAGAFLVRHLITRKAHT